MDLIRREVLAVFLRAARAVSTRVAGKQNYEVRYKAKKTGTSKAKVKRAVKKAGPSRKRVERAL